MNSYVAQSTPMEDVLSLQSLDPGGEDMAQYTNGCNFTGWCGETASCGFTGVCGETVSCGGTMSCGASAEAARPVS